MRFLPNNNEHDRNPIHVKPFPLRLSTKEGQKNNTLNAFSSSFPPSTSFVAFVSTFSALAKISSISIFSRVVFASSSFLSSLKSSSAPNLRIAASSFYRNPKWIKLIISLENGNQIDETLCKSHTSHYFTS